MSVKKEFWGGSDIVYYCLVDEERTKAFRKAILNTVKKGDVVADLGSGTGIFAHFALQAGAKKVYVVEADNNLSTALRAVFVEQEKHGRIILLNEDASKINIPDKLDVVICEMVATGLIDEFQVPAMNHILTFTKTNPSIIPYIIKNFADLVYHEDTFYGLKLPLVRYEYREIINKQASKIASFTRKYMYAEINFSRKNDPQINVDIPFHITRNGTINGIRISNQTVFPDGSTLDGTMAYCMPLILPTNNIIVAKGDTFILHLKYKMCGGLKHLDFSLRKQSTI